MTYRVVLLDRAQRNVQQIHDWIAQRSPEGAARWFNRFTEALATLDRNPQSCSLAPEDELVDYEIRQLIFRTRKGLPYRALFTIVGGEVRVLHVRGPGQNLVEPDEL
jgi:plasmid stabilization system protein ParE